MDADDGPGFDLWSDTTTLFVASGRRTMFVRRSGAGKNSVLDSSVRRALTALRTTGSTSAWATSLPDRLVLLAVPPGQLLETSHAWSFPVPSSTRPGASAAAAGAQVGGGGSAHHNRRWRGAQAHRFRGGAKGPVILVRDGTSTLSSTIDTVDTNLAEFLCAAGYDVRLVQIDRASPDWLPCDNRCSPGSHSRPVGLPGGHREVGRVTVAPSVQVIAHGVGSITLLISLAAERRRGSLGRDRCPQSTMFLRPRRVVRLKTTPPLGSLLQLLGFHLSTLQLRQARPVSERSPARRESCSASTSLHRGERRESPGVGAFVSSNGPDLPAPGLESRDASGRRTRLRRGQSHDPAASWQ